MVLNQREELIEKLAKILPPLYESVDSLITYVLSKEKIDLETVVKVLDVVNSIDMAAIDMPNKKIDLEQASIEETQEHIALLTLQLSYREGIKFILDGCKSLTGLAVRELPKETIESNETYKQFIEVGNYEKAINDLYEGSKKIMQVIDNVM